VGVTCSIIAPSAQAASAKADSRFANSSDTLYLSVIFFLYFLKLKNKTF